MTLAADQARLLEALWQPRHADAAALWPHGSVRGLLAYRSHAQALAVRVLQGACPVMAQLLGEETFAAVACSLWQADPPQRGDLAQWGAGLARHLAGLPGLAQADPYLPDVARAEWLLHAAATAADVPADPGSLGLLAGADPAGLALVLAPGTACVASDWPVASILLAHLDGTPSLAEAGERLRAGQAETVLVWRAGLRPRLRAALPGERAFLAALAAGRSLLEALGDAPALAIDQWLPQAVHEGLLCAVRPLNAQEMPC